MDLFTFQGLRGDIAPGDDPDFANVEAVRDAFEEHIVDLFNTHDLDALVFPPLLSNPPTIESTRSTSGIWESLSDYRNLNPSPFLGYPSITVPAGFKRGGIPFGIEFLGLPYSEPRLIEIAYSFEQATMHRVAPDTTPPLPGETVPEPGSMTLLIAAVALCAHRLAPRRKK